MNDTTPPAFAPAPPQAVRADGTVALGTYEGTTSPGLEALARGRRRYAWKRWHYVSIAGEDVIAAAAVVDVGWARSAFAYLFDRTTQRMLADVSDLHRRRRPDMTVGAPVPGTVALFSSRRIFVRLASAPNGWQLSVRGAGLTIDAELAASASATVCAVAQVGSGIDCTHKTPGLRVTGVAAASGRHIPLETTVAALDHTSALLPRTTVWRWASGCDDTVALNLTEHFTAPAENVLWVEGAARRLPAVHFAFDTGDPTGPWHIASDDRTVDLIFTPEGVRREDRNLVLAASRYVQPVGSFSGTVADVEIDGLPGVTEDHLARW